MDVTAEAGVASEHASNSMTNEQCIKVVEWCAVYIPYVSK